MHSPLPVHVGNCVEAIWKCFVDIYHTNDGWEPLKLLLHVAFFFVLVAVSPFSCSGARMLLFVFKDESTQFAASNQHQPPSRSHYPFCDQLLDTCLYNIIPFICEMTVANRKIVPRVIIVISWNVKLKSRQPRHPNVYVCDGIFKPGPGHPTIPTWPGTTTTNGQNDREGGRTFCSQHKTFGQVWFNVALRAHGSQSGCVFPSVDMRETCQLNEIIPIINQTNSRNCVIV